MAAVYRPAAASELTLALGYGYAAWLERIHNLRGYNQILYDGICMTAPPAPDGIRFTLEGIDEITFAKVLRDLMKDPAFARPLSVHAAPPMPQPSGHMTGAALTGATLTLVFSPEDRNAALSAMQRLKTILLRYGVQIDSVWTPEGR